MLLFCFFFFALNVWWDENAPCPAAVLGDRQWLLFPFHRCADRRRRTGGGRITSQSWELQALICRQLCMDNRIVPPF